MASSPTRARKAAGSDGAQSGTARPGPRAALHARALELDVREQHVEEKVNALETMKLLLTTGSAHEQRLRAALDQVR